MKLLLVCLAASGLWAQGQPAAAGPLLGSKEAGELATRMKQLMESTAVAVPDLVRASASLQQSAQTTVTALAANAEDPTLTWQFMNEVRAYLALSDSMPRPYPFPAEAGRQFAELREDLDRLQQHFAALLNNATASARNRNADPNDLKRYADADTKLLPAGANPRVVFLGDSITDLWRLNEYFTGRDFVNRGIGGQTTTQMLGRFRQDVIDINPKLVVILAGTNDIADGIAPAQIEENLASMGDLAKAHGIRVIFASLLPVGDNQKTRPPATIQAINKWIQTLCLTGGFTWMDYYSAMADATGHMKADLSDDGLHPNGKGYRVMSPVALAAIDLVLHQPEAEDNAAKRRFHILGR